MATPEENAARREAQRQELKMGTRTVNPSATPGAGRGTRNAGGWGSMPAPGSRLGERVPDRTAQQSALGGAFGTGAKRRAENLAGRQDVFSRMQDPKADMDALNRRAGGLGVTQAGWEGALGKINMGQPQPAPKQPINWGEIARGAGNAVKNLFGMRGSKNQETLASNAPPPPVSPPAVGAEPNQARHGADVGRRNMANMGATEAAEDYFRRSAEDQQASNLPWAIRRPANQRDAKGHNLGGAYRKYVAGIPVTTEGIPHQIVRPTNQRDYSSPPPGDAPPTDASPPTTTPPTEATPAAATPATTADPTTADPTTAAPTTAAPTTTPPTEATPAPQSNLAGTANALGAANLTRAAAAQLADRGSGRLLATATSLGQRGAKATQAATAAGAGAARLQKIQDWANMAKDPTGARSGSSPFKSAAKSLSETAASKSDEAARLTRSANLISKARKPVDAVGRALNLGGKGKIGGYAKQLGQKAGWIQAALGAVEAGRLYSDDKYRRAQEQNFASDTSLMGTIGKSYTNPVAAGMVLSQTGAETSKALISNASHNKQRGESEQKLNIAQSKASAQIAENPRYASMTEDQKLEAFNKLTTEYLNQKPPASTKARKSDQEYYSLRP